MINHEKENYISISSHLKQQFQNIELTDQKLRFYQGAYPVVSFVQTNNTVIKQSLTFNEDENINYEEYELEIQSDLDMNEIRNIMNSIDEKMNKLGYKRVYCGLDTQDQETKLKRLMRYTNVL